MAPSHRYAHEGGERGCRKIQVLAVVTLQKGWTHPNWRAAASARYASPPRALTCNVATTTLLFSLATITLPILSPPPLLPCPDHEGGLKRQCVCGCVSFKCGLLSASRPRCPTSCGRCNRDFWCHFLSVSCVCRGPPRSDAVCMWFPDALLQELVARGLSHYCNSCYHTATHKQKAQLYCCRYW